MKTLKFFLFVATIFTLSACSSDDDNGGPVQIALTVDNLTGTFEFTFYEGMAQTTTTAQGSTVVIETETYSGDTFTNARVTFNDDGTYELSGSYRETSTITVTGQSPMTEMEIVTFDHTGTYSVNTESRTINFDGDVQDVTYFDGSNLTLRGEDTETSGGFTYTDSFEYRLVKM